MNRYERVIQILDQAIGGSGVQIGVHGAFWRGLTRDEFVEKMVRGQALLVSGDGEASNLVKALRGQSPFGVDLPDPEPGARFSRMPAGLPPVSNSDIGFISSWIDAGCPDDQLLPLLRWKSTNAPIASSRTDDIWFLDPQIGWAVNSNGQIIHTTDSGDSWTEQLSDEEVYFRCIAFSSATRGWAGTLTAGKTLYDTRDGGNTWLRPALPELSPPAICGLSVVSDSVVFASGTNFPNRPPRMMRTLDGGDSWTAWEMKPWADLLIDTHFLTPERGWVVGGRTEEATPRRSNVKAVVLFTEDAGRTWTDRLAPIRDSLPPGEWGWKIYFLDDLVGFVSLENFAEGAILRTDDGGFTWRRMPVNDPQRNANLEGIGFVDENRGWVGGWGDAAFERLSSSETRDGGLTWHDANEIGQAINRFRFFGNPVSVGYAAGRTVYKYSSEPLDAADHAVRTASRRVGSILDDTSPLGVVGEARITITVPAGASRLAVRIWDRFGEFALTLLDERDPADGRRALVWDRTDETGRALPSGHYIWRVTIDGCSESRLVLCR